MNGRKSILVYEKSSAPLLRVLGAVGVFQVAAWAAFGAVSWRNSGASTKATAATSQDTEEDAPGTRSVPENTHSPSSRYQTWWPAGGLLVSVLFLQLMSFYAKRNVKSIRFVGDFAERARIVTHSLFRSGREDQPSRLVLEVPTFQLHASATGGTDTKQDLVTFGIRGYNSFFQIDRKRGQIYDATLLNALLEKGGQGVMQAAAQRMKTSTPKRTPSARERAVNS
jgi:hypothetical protein